MTNGNGGNGKSNGMVVASGPAGQSPAGYSPGPPLDLGEPVGDGLALRDYLHVLWRRKWVILLVVVVATTSAFFFAYRQPKQYVSTATIIYDGVSAGSSAVVGTGGYTNVYDRDVMMNAVNDLLQSPELVKRTRSILEDKGYPDAEVLVTASRRGAGSGGSISTESIVTVTSGGTDPELAAATANAAAEAFVSWGTGRVRDQIERSIKVVKDRMSTYKGNAKESTEYLLLEQRVGDLKILETTASGGFRVLLPAEAPTVPYAPNPTRSAFLGFGIGLVAALCLAFLLELFDTRLRRPEDIVAILQQPVLGRIPRIPKELLGENAVVALTHPEGSPAEAFRLLRTNLEFVRVVDGFKSLLVTSSVQGEGKSVFVANFAITLAAGGKKIVIVDADLRRPRQHNYFGLENEQGVSTVATGQTPLEDALQKVYLADPAAGTGDVDFEAWARGSGALSRIYVLTSGPLPPNPGEIVSSKRFGAMLDALTSEADVVIIDSPAMLAVGDTPAMASMVDGLLFLVDMNIARRPMMKQAAEQLRRLPCRVLGLALRMDSARGGHYYYSSYSKYGYYASPDGSGKKSGRRAEGAAKV